MSANIIDDKFDILNSEERLDKEIINYYAGHIRIRLYAISCIRR